MDEKKTVCFILPSFQKEAKGGSEIQAYMMARELLHRGWDVHYLRENDRKIGEKEIIEGMTIHSLPERHTKMKWLNIKPLFELMTEIKANVLYTRGTISYVYPVWKNARKIGGKVLWSCSSDRFLSRRYLRELKRESLLRRIATRIDRYLFFKTIRKIDLIILQSDKQKKLLERNWGLKGHVIYNGYPMTCLSDTQKEPLILWVGRLQQSKHPERFMDIVKRMRKKPYRFLALGREVEPLGFPEKFSQLEKECPSFKYLGEIPQEKVFHLYQRARLLVSTSDYEGFSNTFIEAWLHGVPVVSLCMDPDDLIQKNRLGLVSQDFGQLAKDIEYLMEDQPSWRQTSKRCRKFAEEHFNIIDTINQLEELINSLH